MVLEEVEIDVFAFDRNASVYCSRVIMSTSGGIWLSNQPDMYTVPLFLIQIIIIFTASSLVHAVLRHLGQSIFISQLIAGALLGRSFLGHSSGIYRRLFAIPSWEQQHLLGILAYMLFLFMIGVKSDITMIPRSGKKAVAIAIGSTILPMVSVYLVDNLWMGKLLPSTFSKWLVIGVAQRWSFSSYVNLACALNELNLLTSKLGRLAMSAALIAGFANLFISAVFTAYLFAGQYDSAPLAIVVMLAFISFFVFLVFVVRPCVLWLLKRTPEGSLLDEGTFVTILLIALACGLVTEILGYNLMVGPFMLGLVLPGGAPLGTTIVERLEELVSGIFLPMFLVSSGLLIDLGTLTDYREWGYLELLLLLTVATKFVGVVVPCLYCRMPVRHAISLGIMMNIKGIFEVDAAWRWQENQLVDDQLYTTTIVTIIVLGGVTVPLVKYLYHPEDSFFTCKLTSIQETKRTDELRVLACIHTQDNVNPIITLLEASNPSMDSPICIYLLHLVQLLGRSDAVLIAHKPKSSASTESTHIFNAFYLFEQQYPAGGVSVIPYICISPYASMHDDICSLSMDKKVTFIILPFHLNSSVKGTTDTGNAAALQTVNVRVLNYAPCSVGILIDHGLSGESAKPSGGKLIQHVAVYFIGGADDREALAYAARMAYNSTIGLTLVRFLVPEEGRKIGGSERMDNEVVRQFRQEMVDDKRVIYQEEVVNDGEATVSIIRQTSSRFSLLIVGRREGHESPLTAGMSMWSEYPELGVIGDLLAGTEFGSRVTTLVVQQQQQGRVAVQVHIADSSEEEGQF